MNPISLRVKEILSILICSTTILSGAPMTSTNISVEGDPNAVDSYAACLTAVLKSWGNPVDYNYVEGLLGMTFSPIKSTGEDCIGWMMDGNNDFNSESVGKALGFTIRRIDNKYTERGDWVTAYSKTKTVPPAVQTYFNEVKAEFEKGNSIILHTWPAWSVLTKWDDDLNKISYATTPGFEPVVRNIFPPIKSNFCFVVTRSNPETAPARARLEAIKLGAKVASGILKTDGVELGGAMYPYLALRTKEQFLCGGCRKDDCISRSFKRINNSQISALSLLKQVEKELPEGKRNDLGQVLADYEKMKMISDKYLNWDVVKTQAGIRDSIRNDLERVYTIHKEAAVVLGRF